MAVHVYGAKYYINASSMTSARPIETIFIILLFIEFSSFLS